jgi:hypothetical protein
MLVGRFAHWTYEEPRAVWRIVRSLVGLVLDRTVLRNAEAVVVRMSRFHTVRER